MPDFVQTREPRIQVRLQFKIWGTDSDGKPFWETAFTRDVSRVGARLAPIARAVAADEIIGVQYLDRKCRCRVVWVGKAGTPEQGQIGIRCVDEADCPWSEVVISERKGGSDSTGAADGATTAERTWPAVDRRASPRYRCTGTVRMQRVSDSVAVSAQLADISLEGCYAETMSPLPVGSDLNLILAVGGQEIPVVGVVVTCHATMGNGIRFTKISTEARQGLQTLIASLAEPNSTVCSGVAGTPSSGNGAEGKPVPQVPVETRLEALLDVLERKSILNRKELLEQVERLMTKIQS